MQTQQEYKYTINKDVDSSLTGLPAKLVLMFEEGSAIEVDVNDVSRLEHTLNIASSPYINIGYEDGRRSCDCYGDISLAISFNLVCYEPEEDIIWKGHNTKTNEKFMSWHQALNFFRNNHTDYIELIEAIYEPIN